MKQTKSSNVKNKLGKRLGRGQRVGSSLQERLSSLPKGSKILEVRLPPKIDRNQSSESELDRKEYLPENSLPNSQAAKKLLESGYLTYSLYLLQLARQGLPRVEDPWQKDDLEQVMDFLERQPPELAVKALESEDSLSLEGLNREDAEIEVLNRILELTAQSF